MIDLGAGRTETLTHRYVAVASGMHYADPVTGQWTTSLEQFEILPGGYAVARHGQHRVIISPRLNDSAGAVDLHTPDGRRLRGTLLALNLFNRATSDSLVVAEVSPSAVGLLVAPNEILFTNAFEGFAADVRYVYNRGDWRQEVLPQERLDSAALALAGFPVSDSVLEIWTEWFEAPEPTIRSRVAHREISPVRRMQMTEPDILAEDLDFGALKLPSGRIYLKGGSRSEAAIYNRWLRMDGRVFLVETIPLDVAVEMFAHLPAGGGSSSDSLQEKELYAGRRAPTPSLARKASETILTAQTGAKPTDGFAFPAVHRTERPVELVMDAIALNGSLTNYVFRGDGTFLVTGATYLYGTNRVEGNTVVKYEKNVGAKLVFFGPVTFDTDFYRPAVFTAKDDRSVGQSYDLGNGNPTGYYADTALVFSSGSDVQLQHVRIAYAQTAVKFYEDYLPALTARHVQIRNCAVGLNVEVDLALDLGNALFVDVDKALTSYSDTTIKAAHVTASRCNNMVYDHSSGYGHFAFTNSVFANVTNVAGSSVGSLTGTTNAFYNTTSFGSGAISLGASPFEAAWHGYHYLSAGSALGDIGTTNIPGDLLDDLRKATTQAPIIHSNVTFSTDVEFGPEVAQDSGLPDLGAHYAPLDHLFGGCHVYGNLTVQAGTALGWFRTSTGWNHAGHGIHVGDNKTAVFEGTATAPVHWVRTHTVQEGQNGVYGGHGPGGISGWAISITNQPLVRARFLHCSMMADEPGNHLGDDYGYIAFCATDSVFNGGYLTGYAPSHFLTNCLMRRLYTAQMEAFPGNEYHLRNCTFHGGTLRLSNWRTGIPISVKECAFDGTTLIISSYGADTNYATYDYNAFTNGAQQFPIGGSNDVLVTQFGWQEGPLGDFYLPDDSALTNAGSITAVAAGLYHHTVLTNQTKAGELGDGQISIGYHFVATDGDGIPLDYDGDSLADYFEDTDGNGTYESAGDVASWLTNDSDSDGYRDDVELLQGSDPNASTTTDNSFINLFLFTPSH